MSAPVIDSEMIPVKQTTVAAGSDSVYTNAKQYSLNMLVVGAIDISAPFVGPTEAAEAVPADSAARVTAFNSLLSVPNV